MLPATVPPAPTAAGVSRPGSTAGGTRLLALASGLFRCAASAVLRPSRRLKALRGRAPLPAHAAAHADFDQILLWAVAMRGVHLGVTRVSLVVSERQQSAQFYR